MQILFSNSSCYVLCVTAMCHVLCSMCYAICDQIAQYNADSGCTGTLHVHATWPSISSVDTLSLVELLTMIVLYALTY